MLRQSENITHNLHLHSFTYDFHVRVLSETLSKQVQRQKMCKRKDYALDLSLLLEQRNSQKNSANKSGSSREKNAIAGFLDDFLKYYTLPPLYSRCLVLAGTIVVNI